LSVYFRHSRRRGTARCHVPDWPNYCKKNILKIKAWNWITVIQWSLTILRQRVPFGHATSGSNRHLRFLDRWNSVVMLCEYLSVRIFVFLRCQRFCRFWTRPSTCCNQPTKLLWSN
jgi:hypothetical protein